jgi:hypothetical protein
MKKRIEGVTVYGIDIGKNSFHIVGLDSAGKPVLHTKFRRDRLLDHFANTPPRLSAWRAAQAHSGLRASSRRQATRSGSFPLSL